MKAFDDAGIYLFVDLDDFPTQIEQVLPSSVAPTFAPSFPFCLIHDMSLLLLIFLRFLTPKFGSYLRYFHPCSTPLFPIKALMY
jgi:hypothetical protein